MTRIANKTAADVHLASAARQRDSNLPMPKSLTMTERATRNINAHQAATFARIHWGRRYSEQGGGTMDFWDTLSRSEKAFCCEAVADINGHRIS